MGNLPFFPEQASSVAPQVDLVTILLVGLGGFFSTIVFLLIVYFAVRYRRGSRVDRSNPPTTSLKVELSWVALLFLLSMGTYTAAAVVYINMGRTHEDAMEIYVLGRQWMWEIQHPEGPREINELHVPVGRQVRLIMTSQDVIHSFYVPAFRLKYDVIPGRYTNLSFVPTQAGEYHLFCTEYCGTAHAGMIGQVVVMEPRDFQNWLSTGQNSTVSMPEAGRVVFEEMGCTSCHGPGTLGETPNLIAPDLAGRFGHPVLLEDGSTVTFDENYLRQSVLFPQKQVTAGFDPIMPTYQGQIDEEQLQLLIAYLKASSAIAGQGENLIGGKFDSNERILP